MVNRNGLAECDFAQPTSSYANRFSFVMMLVGHRPIPKLPSWAYSNRVMESGCIIRCLFFFLLGLV